jgi:ferric-dicitrate binding protein FerR (iron transport regulator)
MASPAKLRKIEAMWRAVSIKRTDDERAQALRRFILRLYHVSDARFLTDRQANKMIATLAAMAAHGGSTTPAPGAAPQGGTHITEHGERRHP